MKIRIKTDKLIETKLAFIKDLKSFSSYGLYESKDIADWLCSNLGRMTEVELNGDLKEIKKTFKTSGVLVQDTRDLNILKLGIGDKDDYLQTLSEYFQSLSIDNVKEILNELTKDDLIKLSIKIPI